MNILIEANTARFILLNLFKYSRLPLKAYLQSVSIKVHGYKLKKKLADSHMSYCFLCIAAINCIHLCNWIDDNTMLACIYYECEIEIYRFIEYIFMRMKRKLKLLMMTCKIRLKVVKINLNLYLNDRNILTWCPSMLSGIHRNVNQN